MLTSPQQGNEGSGGLGEDARTQDLSLVRRAIREGWNVPEEAKQRAGEMAWSIAKRNGRKKPGVALKAIRTLLEIAQAQQDVPKTGQVMVVVHNDNRLPDSRTPSETPPGAEAGHSRLQAVQRFDVRATLGEDDAG